MVLSSHSVRMKWMISLIRSQIPAQLSGVIADRILGFDIHVFTSHLVRAARWSIFEDFLFNLGFCQIDSMFDEALDLLIFLLAPTIPPGFPASPLFVVFLDCTVDSHIPPPGLFSPLVFLGRPAHIFSCRQQTGLQLFRDLFCLIAISIAWCRLCDENPRHPEVAGP